ncbi:hypothetical protein Amsp01_090110 [Amycolatopsis sp. NBRC 101858]|nr:hypothetical protein Amsp01_090110 [Amycolatopsis sp. NBRC 101858]
MWTHLIDTLAAIEPWVAPFVTAVRAATAVVSLVAILRRDHRSGGGNRNQNG